jgi:hypothetical protein
MNDSASGPLELLMQALDAHIELEQSFVASSEAVPEFTDHEISVLKWIQAVDNHLVRGMSAFAAYTNAGVSHAGFLR